MALDSIRETRRVSEAGLIQAQRRLIAALDAVIGAKNGQIANLRRVAELRAELAEPLEQETWPSVSTGRVM